ncbi:Endopolyphosphatase [Viridothelium virens]|uniref:Endopolyphosphatase n=1 Tax=Viridothelium virens TaxID=1048519 RepID=A0A6A6HBI3_VIRVR|nr:Endopolyphosphatase [Viridothelium virens]
MRMFEPPKPAAVLLLVLVLWYSAESAIAVPSRSQLHQDALQEQRPLVFAQQGNGEVVEIGETKGLKGRFLHITDFHPDPFYEPYTSTSSDNACHSGHGPAGYYGAETSDCDSPLTLVNATFAWIAQHLASEIDFIVWTGDSARHDNDESIPRTESQVIAQNRLLVSHFRTVFGKHNGDEGDDDPTNDFTVPIVPSIGNNDILPHNIFEEGPNHWTKQYASLWRSFIPEEQRHAFEQGGWFYVEVVPDHLAVFSLNTMYFFGKNAGVDGCADSGEPGYEAFEWLRVRLQLLRERGMKAILSGHVPPARTDSKTQWDETCWQKYALWLRQYRDVIVGGLWGHMNVEHFMLQDFHEIDWNVLEVDGTGEDDSNQGSTKKHEDGEFGIASSQDYLKDLREQWADLPTPPPGMFQEELVKEALSSISDDARPEWEVEHFVRHQPRALKAKKTKEEKQREQFLKEIGGKWHERYGISLVSASVVPNFFPTMRVFEYNTTGIDLQNAFDKDGKTGLMRAEEVLQRLAQNQAVDEQLGEDSDDEAAERKKHKKKKGKKSKRPKFTIPAPPSKSTPPGPAYSPQPFTLLGYSQYYANLTEINNDFHDSSLAASTYSSAAEEGWQETGEAWMDWFGSILKWKEGKHHDKKPNKSKPRPKEFSFQIEYDTRHDKLYKLKDLTVGSWVKLARRIGTKEKIDDATISDDDLVTHLEDSRSLIEEEGRNVEDGKEVDTEKKHKHKKGKKKKDKKKHKKNKVWHAFINRAFVSTMDPGEIDDKYQ